MPTIRLARHVAAGCAAMALLAHPAAAQVRLGETGLTATGTPTIASDYLFRGLSQTRSRPAVQVTGEVSHDLGLYVGAFVSDVAFLGTDARQEVDALAGYRFEALGIKWDVGAIYYAYPGYDRPAGGFTLDYVEVAAKASRAFGSTTLQASAFFSPNYQLRSGRSLYVEGGVDQALPFDVTGSVRLGYLAIERNERFGTPDYLTWSVGASREIAAGFRLGIGYYDTNISRRDCVPFEGRGQGICGARVLVTLSRQF